MPWAFGVQVPPLRQGTVAQIAEMSTNRDAARVTQIDVFLLILSKRDSHTTGVFVTFQIRENHQNAEAMKSKSA